jgi:putative endonuclease
LKPPQDKIPSLPSGWCTYLLFCADGSYYCGITENLVRRIRDHRNGKGARHTRTMKPTALVWYESHATQRAAAARELEIKKWGRRKKQQLAAQSGEWVSLA